MVFGLEEVESRREVRDGSGLKYPAVNVQELLEKRGPERVVRMWVREGSSVDGSEAGWWRGVSWERG